MNQAPTEEESKSTEESDPYIGRIKTVQFIDIFKKVGLMNQAPTEEPNPYRNNQSPTKHKGVLMNQAPTQEPNSCSNVILLFLAGRG